MSIFFLLLASLGLAGLAVALRKPQTLPIRDVVAVERIIDSQAAGDRQALYNWGYDLQESLIIPPFNRWRQLGYADIWAKRKRRDVNLNPPSDKEWQELNLPTKD